MNINRKMYLAIIGILAIVGCSTSSEPTTAAKTEVRDPMMSMYAGIPFSGLLEGKELRGKFTNFCFEKVIKNGEWATENGENGQLLCNLTGKAEIWEESGPISYTITGHSVGRDLVVKLRGGKADISGVGTLIGDNLFDASCSMVLRYGNKDCTVSLTITTDAVIADSRTNFFESRGIK